DVTVEGFNGLGKTNPWLALCGTICLLSLTGIPLTAGFQAKFYMLVAAIENGFHFWIVIVAVLFAAVSAYYYFRVIQAMYFRPPSAEPLQIEAGPAFKGLLIITALLIIALGINPEWLIGWLYH
ncbi:MAG: NADH-quinone oxidoreductase subunit N, partial [Chitinophagaceae bacterium]